MAGQGYSWLLRFYLLLCLACPLDPSNQPERDTGTLALLPEELELQELKLHNVDPEPTPLIDTVVMSWMCFLVELLTTGAVLRRCLGKRPWRRQREEKRQSPSACAGPCGCRGRGCPKKLMQLLKHNRAMLRLYLRHCSLQRRRAKRAAKGGTWKRKRLQASPQH